MRLMRDALDPAWWSSAAKSRGGGHLTNGRACLRRMSRGSFAMLFYYSFWSASYLAQGQLSGDGGNERTVAASDHGPLHNRTREANGGCSSLSAHTCV